MPRQQGVKDNSPPGRKQVNHSFIVNEKKKKDQELAWHQKPFNRTFKAYDIKFEEVLKN
jgi:hypothetical protein